MEGWPGSYGIVELLSLGVNYEDLPLLQRRSATIARLAGIPGNRFFSECMINLAVSHDNFREIDILDDLKAKKCDPALVNMTSFFDAVVGRVIRETGWDGINPYIGKHSPDQLTSFLVRSTGFVAGNIDSPEIKDMLFASSGRVVLDIMYKEMAAYREEWMTSEEMTQALCERIKDGMRPAFLDSVGRAMGAAKRNMEDYVAALDEGFSRILPAFASREADAAMHNIAVGEAFRMFAADSAVGNMAKGLRRHGRVDYLERLRDGVFQGEERGFSRRNAFRLAVRVAAGYGEKADWRWAGHLDKAKPFVYDVPTKYQKRLKMTGLAARAMVAGMKPDELTEKVENEVRNHSMLGCIGTRSAKSMDICLSSFCMIGRGVVAAKRFGDENEAWELYKEVTDDSGDPAPSLCQ